MKQFLFLTVLASLIACGPSEKQKLKDRVAELESELAAKEQQQQEQYKIQAAVIALLDSIEAYEKSMTIDLEKGMTKEDYTGRIRGLGEKLAQTQKKVSELEKALSKAGKTNKSLTALVNDYKKKLAEKEETVAKLTAMVEKLSAEKDALVNINELQKQEIAAQEAEIQKNKADIAKMEEEIKKLQQGNQEAKELARKKEADLNFMQGEKTYQMARKTLFAAKKKKELLNQALALFKAAFEGGRRDALEKIEMIEKELK